MSRARATALTLVNWKGVFFEHYWLDRHVTALEGANGAGKTTVMIAAYVVLLPDLTRLRFVNLGETGPNGGDKGIWGRLGEAGPSYSAIEVDPGDGQRLTLGVYLERKAAPSLSLTPFVISGMDPAQSVQRLFLDEQGGHEQVSTLEELTRKARGAGLCLEIFSSIKDYFASLFERGVSPLRLGTDEERNKWNEMLRTSMTGGISRTLTSDLRSFLFKQESGLSDTLRRMHENLDACRRTRIEVSEARVLEHEITGVASAGQAMFGAVIDASREQARESRARRERAEQRAEAELRERSELETRLAEAQLRQHGVAPRLERARLAENRARDQLALLTRALAAAARSQELEDELRRREPEARAALEQKAQASAARQRAKAELDAAQQTLLRAATGLGSLQSGLEELHRQAHSYRRLREELRRANEELALFLGAGAAASANRTDSSELARIHASLLCLLALGSSDASAEAATPADVGENGSAQGRAWSRDARSVVIAARRELDRTRAERDRDRELAQRRRAAKSEARAALLSLGVVSADVELRARAHEELARLAELELLAKRLSELRTDWQRKSALAQRQRALRAELDALGITHLGCAADFIAHLGGLETALKSAEQARREHELAAQKAAEGAELARARQSTLEARRDIYRNLAQSAARLNGRGAPPPETRADLTLALRANDEARQILVTRAAELARDSQAALASALEHEASLGGLDPEIALLAELCEGEPLAARYDDLDSEAARRTEAELGPLLHAIVVQDPERAAEQIRERLDGTRDVWLLRAGAALPAATTALLPVPRAARTAPAASDEGEPIALVAVDLGHGLRLSPLPETASLGRAARRRRAEALRTEAEAASRASAELTMREREERAARRDLEALQEHWDVWTGGDPEAELLAVQSRLAELHSAENEARELTRRDRIEAARLEAERDGVRAQLAHHHLLDPPDHGEEAAVARAVLDRAEGAQAELERAAQARSSLLAHIHDLESKATDDDDDATWRDEKALLDAQRDRLFSVAEALELIEVESAAWGWWSAERAVAERTRLVPQLEEQHQRAHADLTQAQHALEATEAAWESATERAQAASAALGAVQAHLDRARTELSAHGVPDPDAAALEHARAEVEAESAAVAELRRIESGIEAELALGRERAHEAEKRAESARRELELERARELPAARAWQELAQIARQAELATERPVREGAGEATLEDASSGASAQRWLEARAKCELLGDRLARARGGAELAESVRAALSDEPDAGPSDVRGSRYLQLWIETKRWLARRLPTPLSDASEPLLGLARLEADLSELEQRLTRQEGDLGGTSADVARSIEVQLRRASAQLRRLNRSLDDIRFGSIHAIRVQMDRVEKMDRVLGALRDGKTQELLFQSNLPIEAALDEIFRRHAGGRTGGQRLLDFREYLELSVQIERRPDQPWERVSASQVSTGEAIGIGAALMMVILTEWEREDQLLRRRREHGSLRFLFLDEANRLSQDNLTILFDLCQNLDLQLLIAAPEVARAEGNTTYRLVRRVSEDGREEVLVTGRRATLPEIATATNEAKEPAPPKPEQVALFGE